MEVFRRNKKAVGYHLIIGAYLCILLCSGCTRKDEVKGADVQGQEETGAVWEPSYELTEDTLLSWDFIQRVETDNYILNSEIWTRPYFFLKEGGETLCGEAFWQKILTMETYGPSYQILYADDYYLCFYQYTSYSEYGEGLPIATPRIHTICLQNPVFEVGNGGYAYIKGDWPELYSMQEDTDYPNGFWPGNGINLSLEKILQEIEGGNCYMDRAGYEVYQESPERFIESIREQFKQIEEIDFAESYRVRFGSTEESLRNSLRMYIREGRVGFFICLKDKEPKWEDFPMPIDFYFDFRIEVEYDWKQDAPVYQMPYEVYSLMYEDELCGEVLYPQVKGLDTADKINVLMKENVQNNIKTINIDLINQYRETIISDSHSDWTEKPPIGPPRVLFRSERYLCIRQEPFLPEQTALRYMEGWQRDYVYDLETGECLALGDIVSLDEEFVSWLQETEKVEGGIWLMESIEVEEIPGLGIEELRQYQKDFLLETLEKAEFYLKSGQLFIRLPNVTYDEGDSYQYSSERQTGPNYLEYISCRISVEDLGDFLIAEPW